MIDTMDLTILNLEWERRRVGHRDTETQRCVIRVDGSKGGDSGG
jgi:hypothetical protein